HSSCCLHTLNPNHAELHNGSSSLRNYTSTLMSLGTGQQQTSGSRDDWNGVPAAFRSTGARLAPHWEALFGPLRAGNVDHLVIVAQAGQSLDGRIATPSGHSHYINCPAARAHLHRLRALVDA